MWEFCWYCFGFTFICISFSPLLRLYCGGGCYREICRWSAGHWNALLLFIEFIRSDLSISCRCESVWARLCRSWFLSPARTALCVFTPKLNILHLQTNILLFMPVQRRSEQKSGETFILCDGRKLGNITLWKAVCVWAAEEDLRHYYYCHYS